MKTRQFFVVAFLFCFAITTQAQQTIMASASPNPNPNYQDDLDARFSALDKSQISTGCLYSRVYPAAQLLTFNQNSQQDVSSAGHFKQAYSELYNSLYNKTIIILKILYIRLEVPNKPLNFLENYL